MRSLFVCLLMLTGTAAIAATSDNQDLEVLPRPAHADLVDYRDIPSLERRYPQEPVQRISGQVRLNESVLVEGRLRAPTYRMADQHSPVEAALNARKTLQQGGAQLLYWCEGRECGSSSLWANNIFDNAKLYGPEERQIYLLLRLAEPQQDSLVAIYGITRGNRRSYLHVEQLDASAPLTAVLPTAATLLRQLQSEGELDLPQLPATPDEAWSALLLRTLKLDSTLRVTLSGEGAAAWRDLLLSQRVRENRLQLGEQSGPGLHLSKLR